MVASTSASLLFAILARPTATVDASATVGEGAAVGPHATVGAEAVLGARVVLAAMRERLDARKVRDFAALYRHRLPPAEELLAELTETALDSHSPAGLFARLGLPGMAYEKGGREGGRGKGILGTYVA